MPAPSGLTAAQLAELVGGELVGRPDLRLTGVASLEQATSHMLSFLASPRYLPYFQRSSAGAVLVGPAFRDLTTGPVTRIVVTDPYQALQRVLPRFHPEEATPWGVHPTARVGRGTRWMGRIAVGQGVILGCGVTAGRDCRIGPYACIEDHVRLGDECLVEPHAIRTHARPAGR